MRQLKGPLLLFVTLLLAGAALFHLWYVGITDSMPTRVLRGMHLAMFVPLVFLLYPASRKRSPLHRPSLLDWAIALLGAFVYGYVAWNYHALDARIPMVSPVTRTEVVLGIVATVILVEAVRRVIGSGMAVVAVLAIAYLLWGANLPGMFGFRALSLPRIVENLYLSKSEGMFGDLTGLSAQVLILFIVFGVFLAKTGIAEWFGDVSVLLAGNWKGGSGKMAILYSALCGSMSGSPTADLYTTGTYTIPLMKRNGYTDSFAAGVAAASAVGAQIMPPVMGASVFIMAATLSRSYLSIAIAALPAALLFFLAKWTAVHCEATRRELPVLRLETDVNLRSVLLRSYYLLPLLALIVALFAGYSPTFAAMVGIGGSIVVSCVRRQTWLTPRRLLETLAEGSRAAMFVAVPCAAAGIIISALTATGLGLAFSSIITGAAHGFVFLTLILVAAVSILMGVGVPTTPAYILVSVISTPALTHLGVDALAANLFVLYFAVLSNIHPPVGITAYAASGIAGSPPLRTAIDAFLIAIPGFMVPVAFCYHPSLLLLGGAVPFLLHFMFTALSVIGVSRAIWGYKQGGRWATRLACMLAGFALVAPSMAANLAGLAWMLASLLTAWLFSAERGAQGMALKCRKLLGK